MSIKKWEPIGALSLLIRYGENSGDSTHAVHISVHRATTKYFSNSFVFKTKIEKEGLPRDITPALGAGGLRFESGRPDQLIHKLAGMVAILAPETYPYRCSSGGFVEINSLYRSKSYTILSAPAI